MADRSPSTETVIVYIGSDYAAAEHTLRSIETATKHAPDTDFQVLALVDDQGEASLTVRSARATLELLPIGGLTKWAAIARAQQRSVNESPSILYAGEAYTLVMLGPGHDEVWRDESVMSDDPEGGGRQTLAGLNITFNDRVSCHPDTVFEGSSKWYSSIDNRRPAHFGAFSYSYSPIPRTVTHIGRYCSIASDVLFGAAGHPTDFLSTSPFTYEPDHPPFDALWERAGVPARVVQEFTEDQQYPDITIGNDVWIGARASIRGGVTLGHGCIVGTGAVVTRDVPAYAVVGGVPARTLRYRFDQDLVERLLDTAWWRFDPVTLSRFPLGDPRASLDLLEVAERAGEIAPWSPETRPLVQVVSVII